MKKTLSFRILSLLFALVFLVTALPLGIFANDTETTAETAVANDGLTATESEGGSLLPIGYEPEPSFVTEVTELRTENVKHFDKGDGTYEAIAYGTAVHRKDADGKWQDIDNTLTLREDRGVERYVSSDARISFAPVTSGDGAIWSLSENGYSVSLSLSEADLRAGTGADVRNHATRAEQVAAAKKADDTDALFRVDNTTKILYRNVLADVDLEYVLSGNDVKETILVQSVCENYDYSFKLSLSGLIPKETEDGAILLLDAESGKEVYLLPAPYMTDANDEYSDAVSYRLTDLGGGEYEIIVSASDEWINAPERAFPVAIDPTVTNQNSSLWDSYTDYSTPTTNYGTSAALWVSNYWITYLQFGLPYIPNGASLNTAYLYVSYYYNVTDGSLTANAYQVLGSWNESQITYNNAPQIASTESASTTMTASPDVTSSAPGTAIFSIANLVRNWYGAPSTNYGVAIRRASGDNMSVILKSREASAGRAYLSINYYIDAGIVDGIYQIKNAASGKYLTVIGQGTTAGTKLEQRTNSYGDHQQFLVRSIGNYEYTIQPLHATGMALSTQSANTGTNVTLASYNANDNAQVFSISKYDSNNSYVIKTKKSDFNNLFTIPLGLPTNGLKVVQLGFDGLASQRWVFEFAGPSDGVYAIKQSGTDSYVDCSGMDCSSSATSKVFPATYETSPSLSSEEYGGLFKFVYRSSTRDFVIRSMLDNAVVVFHPTNTVRKSKRTYVQDTGSTLYGWTISKASATDRYIWTESASGQKQYLTAQTGGELILTTNKSSATKWVLVSSSGTLRELEPLEVLDSHYVTAGETVDISPVFEEPYNYSYRSTQIGDNAPGMPTYSVSNSDPANTPTSVATVTGSGTISFHSGKCGVVKATASYTSGASFSLNFYVAPSSSSSVFFLMQNVQSTGGIDVGYAQGDDSGAVKTAFDNGFYIDLQLWEKIPSQWSGYFYIRNVGNDLYLSSPESTSNGVALEMVSYVSTDLQAWEFTQTVSGAWKIRSRCDAEAGRNLYINIKSASNNTLTQGTYAENDSYRDEFNIITIGSDVVYNRTLTWPSMINPSEMISDLAKWYDTYTLIHPRINLDCGTAKDLLEDSKIAVFNGHGSYSAITIHEYPQRYLEKTDIYVPENPSASLDLSDTDIAVFAGCSTGANGCSYCRALCETAQYVLNEGHYPGCPNSNNEYFNMPKSALYAGAEVAIGWIVKQCDNNMNDWIDYFFSLLNSIHPNSNNLYTAKQALDAANAMLFHGDVDYAVLYGNRDFRLSDTLEQQ